MRVSQFQVEQLVERACQGDERAASELLEIHRQWLRWIVGVRMDGRLSARVDASDVVQS